MTFAVVPFEPAHLVGFDAQGAQAKEFTLQPEATSAAFGEAWTATVHGYPIACAGWCEMWPGRAYAWALLSVHARHHMLRLTRGIRSRLTVAPFRRVEMAVDVEFPQAARWAEMLGFVCETPVPMRGFFPDGRPGLLYSRVK